MAYLNEESLEKLIVDQMVEGAWREGNASAFNASYALDLGELVAFVSVTQPQLVDALGLSADSPAQHKFLARLQGEITKRGVVHLLRNGVDHLGHHVDLYYPMPTPGNARAAEAFAANWLRAYLEEFPEHSERASTLLTEPAESAHRV